MKAQMFLSHGIRHISQRPAEKEPSVLPTLMETSSFHRFQNVHSQKRLPYGTCVASCWLRAPLNQFEPEQQGRPLQPGWQEPPAQSRRTSLDLLESIERHLCAGGPKIEGSGLQ